MPIRINLLAEAQAAEEMRRRDPVKRGMWIGACMVALVLAWASTLQARIALQKGQLSNLEGQITDIENQYKGAVESQKRLMETRQKLAALDSLHTNRYLAGNLMDALQRAYVEDVRVTKVKTEFNYKMTAPTPPKTNAFNVIAGKPATATEQIKIEIEAVDSSSNPGDRVSVYRETIAGLPHVQKMFNGESGEVRLTGLSSPKLDASGRQFVSFTLECPYPEKVR